jgi:hypothetical protein
MGDDLAGMSRKQLIAEVRKLRQGIRTHRDSTLQEFCWHHPELWSDAQVAAFSRSREPYEL